MRSKNGIDKPNQLSRAVARGLRRAARRYGMPIYIWKDGKIVAVKP
jgi:hypothetical protein